MANADQSCSAEAGSLEDGTQSTSQGCSAKFDMEGSVVVVGHMQEMVRTAYKSSNWNPPSAMMNCLSRVEVPARSTWQQLTYRGYPF